MDNHCVMCGSYLADTGRMVCEKCEKQPTELKPCPFCGGEARIINNVFQDLWDISCIDGFCYAHLSSDEARYYELDDAIEAWNRRAEDGT